MYRNEIRGTHTETIDEIIKLIKKERQKQYEKQQPKWMKMQTEYD